MRIKGTNIESIKLDKEYIVDGKLNPLLPIVAKDIVEDTENIVHVGFDDYTLFIYLDTHWAIKVTHKDIKEYQIGFKILNNRISLYIAFNELLQASYEESIKEFVIERKRFICTKHGFIIKFGKNYSFRESLL